MTLARLNINCRLIGAAVCALTAVILKGRASEASHHSTRRVYTLVLFDETSERKLTVYHEINEQSVRLVVSELGESSFPERILWLREATSQQVKWAFFDASRKPKKLKSMVFRDPRGLGLEVRFEERSKCLVRSEIPSFPLVESTTICAFFIETSNRPGMSGSN